MSELVVLRVTAVVLAVMVMIGAALLAEITRSRLSHPPKETGRVPLVGCYCSLCDPSGEARLAAVKRLRAAR